MGKSKNQQKSASCTLQRMPLGSPWRSELEEKTRSLEALQNQLQERETEVIELKKLLEDKNAKLKKIDDIAESCLAQWSWLGPSGQRNHVGKEANLKIESVFKKYGGSGTMNVQSGLYTYEIDFDDMCQRNTHTGTIRQIMRQVFEHDSSTDLEDVILHGLRTIQAVRAEVDVAKEKASLAESRAQELSVNLQDAQEGWEQDRTAKFRAEQEMAQVADSKKHALQQMEEMKSKLTGKEQELLAVSQMHASAKRTINDLEAKVAQAEAVAKRYQQANEVLETMREQLPKVCQAHAEKLARFEEEVRQAKSDAAKEMQIHCAKASARFSEVAALWREPKPFQYILFQEPLSKHAQVCAIFKDLSHKAPLFQGTLSRCHGFQNIKILGVEAVHSPDLWNQYAKCRDALKEKHRALGVDVQPLRQAFDGLDCLLPDHGLDKTVNEVILVHGCGEEAAKNILRDGWDIRFTNTNGGSLYGEGMYFGRQPCKCHQYTRQSNPRRMIVSRVALGDPAYLQDEYVGRLPPCRDEANPQKGRHDSNVVSPDISRRGQSHWEYVIFDGKQAYPEMLITYQV